MCLPLFIMLLLLLQHCNTASSIVPPRHLSISNNAPTMIHARESVATVISSVI